MFRAILNWLRSPADGEDDHPDSGDERDASSGFLRSRLDASVLAAHGADTVAESELEEMQERAGELEEMQEQVGSIEEGRDGETTRQER